MPFGRILVDIAECRLFQMPFAFFIIFLVSMNCAIAQSDIAQIELQTITHDKQRTFEGFTLYPASPQSSVFLFDPHGTSVHRWKVKTVRAKLLPDCTLLAIEDEALKLFDWSGTVLRKIGAEGEIHHDFEVTPSGSILFLVKKNLQLLPRSEEIPFPEKKRKYRSDLIRETTQTGEILWEWHFEEGIDPFSCGAKPCPKNAEDILWIHKVRDWTHANTIRVLPDNKWYRGGDERFRPGNLITMARNLWQGFIIDKQTKKVVWSYSGDYRGGLMFPHDAHMVPEGLPGAGNILIFDNGDSKRGSIALEVNPVTNEVLWKYENGRKFFSNGHGALMRLPNGNTLLSEDFRDRILEVTPSEEVVWRVKGPPGLRRATKYPMNYCKQFSQLQPSKSG